MAYQQQAIHSFHGIYRIEKHWTKHEYSVIHHGNGRILAVCPTLDGALAAVRLLRTWW